MTTTGNNMPISINHVYNSTNCNINNGLGCGWSLSSYEYVKCVNDTPGYPMKYVDSDGTTHYFVDIGNNKSEDEDGLGLTLEYFPNNPTEKTYIITDKNNNKKEFSADGQLTKIIDSNGNYYTQSYQIINGLYRLVSVTDGAGRVTTLNYNSNAKLVSIVDPANRTTQYTYDSTGNYLISITYPDNKTTRYEYNGPGGRMSRAINCDQYRIDYNYSTIAPYRIHWIDEANGSNVGFIMYMSYGYNETYFDENNRRTTYQFNNYGQTTCIKDNEGNAQYYKMGAPGGSGGAANKVTFASKLQKTVTNLLKNHNFEYANSGEWIESTWNLNNGSRSFDGEGYIGSHSARCISYDTDGCFSGYRQCYNAKPNTQYTFSAYVKLKSYIDYYGWNYGALVQINTDSGLFESEKITTVSDDWVRISVTCTTGATVSYFYVEFGIEHAYGEALFDCMQLEVGETANRYNILENAGFEYVTGSTPDFWNIGDRAATEQPSSVVRNGTSGTKSYSITGNGIANKCLYEFCYIKGKAGDSIVYGAWAKANSIPTTHDGISFSVVLCLNYNDGTQGWFGSAFNYGTNEWQLVTDNGVATQDYSVISIYLLYYKNCNTVYFDDAFIYREEFGQSYTYDNNGNIISTQDLAKQNAIFTYTNNYLSKMVNPDGTSYEYQYDSSKRVTSAKSAEGIKYYFSYDSFGNVTSSTMQNDSSSQSIVAGKSYYIRNKNSGKYLDVYNGNDTNGTIVQQYQFGGSNNQKWRVEAAGNGYYYLVPLHSTSNKVLDVPGNSSANGVVLNIFDRNGSDAQKFNIIPNDDGSYKILTRSSFDASGITIVGGDTNNGSQAKQWEYAEGNDQKWYFEDTEQPTISSPTDSGVYFIRSRNSGQYLDVYDSQDANGTSIIQYYFHGSKNQQFMLISTGDGYYKIAPINSTTGKVLDVTGGVNANFVYIQLCSDNNTDAQKFKFISNGNGTYRIVSKCSSDEKCLDVEDVSFNAGARVHQYVYGGGLNQQWILEKVSDKINSTATYTADGNYMSTLTDARGETISYSYNNQTGTLTSVTNPKGHVTNYTYNPNTDALETVSNGDSTISVGYTYDNYKLDTIVHNGFVYDLDYDWARNNVAFKVGNQTLITNTYNYSKELLTRSNYGNGQYVEYEYDSLDRISRKKTNGSTSFEYVYDAEGNLGILKDYVNSNTIRYVYDLSGRLTRIKNSNGLTIQIKYDAYSRVSEYIQKLGTSSNTVGFRYGEQGAINPYGGNPEEKTGLTYGITLNGARKISYEYDCLTRRTSKTLNTTNPYTTYYTYLAGKTPGTTTTMLAGIQNGTDPEISYTYDANGNIKTIKEGGVLKATYTYDNQNQLVREDNGYTGKTVTYTYNAGGNITLKSEYAYTTGDLGTPTKTYSYQYGDNNWKDKLTSYDGQTIMYDAIGNPLTYRGKTFTWQNGRELAGISGAGLTATYKYNDGGIRTQKTVNGVTTNYYLDGTQIVFETNGTDTIYYLRDENGTEVGFTLNGAEYYYVKNGQGDVIGILDSNGSRVVSYIYDSWGALVSTTGTLAATVGQKNPIRYRGYYYDVETGFYSLQSRYYDPEIGRFINADDTDVLGVEQGSLLQYNLFTYCLNNPVNRTDDSGYLSIPNWLKVTVGAVAIAGLAVATVATGGAAAVICGAALSGAIAGGASGAVLGAVGGGISGGWQGALDGACSGFMSGTLIGGATGAVAAGFNIATGATSVVGKAHGSTLHKLATNMEAGKMAASGQYSQIGLNKSLNTMGLNGKLRPDVIGIGKKGVNKLVEVVSPKQSINYISNKMNGMLSNNPGSVGKIVSRVRNLFK